MAQFHSIANTGADNNFFPARDDLGVSLMTDEIRRDFLEPIEDRYSVRSTIITSQLPVDEWHDYFGGGRIADALMDRLSRNAHRLDLKGPSRRPELEDEIIHKDHVD